MHSHGRAVGSDLFYRGLQGAASGSNSKNVAVETYDTFGAGGFNL